MPSAILLSDTCGGLETVLVEFAEADAELGLGSPQLTIKDAPELRAYVEMVCRRGPAPSPPALALSCFSTALPCSRLVVLRHHHPLPSTFVCALVVEQVPLANFSEDFAYPLRPIVTQGAGPFLRQYFQQCGGADQRLNGERFRSRIRAVALH